MATVYKQLALDIESLNEDSSWSEILKIYWRVARFGGLGWSILAGVAVGLHITANWLTSKAESLENWIINKD